MQLRYLQTVTEVAVENNSTTLFPIPIDLFAPFIKESKQASSEARAAALVASTDAMASSLPGAEDAGVIADGSAGEMLASAAKKMLGEMKETTPAVSDDE